ncbi:MAG: flippase-like domain-containing protein [Candidatus Eremiobacteraeota bacterium]|nr:flippase-like domain-containing protein [Candidatus Eremiobacteraeota bacterium]
MTQKPWKTLRIPPGHLLMGICFLTGLGMAGRKFLDARELKLVFDQLNFWFIPVLLALPLGYLRLKSIRYADLFCLSGPPLEKDDRRATSVSYMAAQMVTLLPGGYVARIGLVEASSGLGTRAVLPTLLEKGIDLFVLLSLGLGTSYLFPQTRHYSAMLGLIIAAVLAAATSSRFRGTLKHLLQRLASKFGKEETARKALAGRNPGSRQLLGLALKTGGVISLELSALWLSFRALGLEANPLLLIMAYCTADLIGRIAPTPGGVGFTEIGMVALLHSFSPLSLNQAAAATFLFRAVLYLAPAIYGFVSYALLWVPMTERSQRSALFRATPETGVEPHLRRLA